VKPSPNIRQTTCAQGDRKAGYPDYRMVNPKSHTKRIYRGHNTIQVARTQDKILKVRLNHEMFQICSKKGGEFEQYKEVER
jgi:hypothetical protein